MDFEKFREWRETARCCIDGKNVEQSATGSDVINNIVIIQISTENLFVLIIISWPLIPNYRDCRVTAVLMHYIHLKLYANVLAPLVVKRRKLPNDPLAIFRKNSLLVPTLALV